VFHNWLKYQHLLICIVVKKLLIFLKKEWIYGIKYKLTPIYLLKQKYFNWLPNKLISFILSLKQTALCTSELPDNKVHKYNIILVQGLF